MAITPLSARTYFVGVGIISVLGIVYSSLQNPAIAQSVGELMGWREPLIANADSFYVERVDPILEAYCVNCHGDERDKGALRLDTYRHVWFGGKRGSVIQSGNSEGSRLIERMLLPKSDPLAMPPEGRDRFTKDELKVLQLWIDKGASGSLVAADFPDAPAPVVEIEFPTIDWQLVAADRAPLAEYVKDLQKQYPTVLQYLARTSATLRLNASLLGEEFGDEALAQFLPVLGEIVEADFTRTALTSASLEHLQKMSRLKFLTLPNIAANRELLDALTPLQDLERLSVPPSQIKGEEGEVMATFRDELSLRGVRLFIKET